MHSKVPEEMIRMEVEGLVGVLHEPVKFVPNEKMWIMENFFTKLFQ